MRRIENWLPLRGRWLGYFLAGIVLSIGLLGRVALYNDINYCIHFAHDPNRHFNWQPPPRQGLDCKFRMVSSHNGYVVHSLRLGDVVFEVAQDSKIRGPWSLPCCACN
jgi:hypothetical protein